MKILPITICCLLFAAACQKMYSQNSINAESPLEKSSPESINQLEGIPENALILEKRIINSTAHPNRELILWMLNAEKHPSGMDAEDSYTCPRMTRGSHYTGATRFSLVDTKENEIINTIAVSGDFWEDQWIEETFDIPYLIRKNDYYFVPKFDEKGAGKPAIMQLKDFNGDGKPFEFGLYSAENCVLLQTTLIGYSEKRDKVMRYPVELETVVDGEFDAEFSAPSFWVDHLFAKKPIRPGFWRFQTDYRGHGGWLAKYEVRYNEKREKFEGTINATNKGDSTNK